ncbi:MAG: branched-chain amino acid ABC transporter permease [Chloroflexi bacterium]|nr:branched-chain amino acid ABC transporter permease [Chloroflexota bacterium]MBM3182523.1 branched-chain amino acid ABC transporter permease [Chloroflexota bacterium]MBM4451072.1 branched-chain amino acid ABC transporter permease [Chloroflexota bacterium]
MLPCGVFNRKYSQDMAIVRTRHQWGILIATFLLLLILPSFASNYFLSLINFISITIIVTLGLQIISGYCGQISFGQAAFMAVGAYVSAILTSKLGLSFWIALPLSGIAAGLLGIIGGAPSLRIKGFYLAIATIAIHALVMWFVLHSQVTGGVSGLHVPAPKIGPLIFKENKSMYYIIVPVMVLLTLAAKNLTRSKVGRAFVAIRDNDLAAEVMGINVYYYKLLAFFISCLYAGVGGSLFAHWMQMVHPEQFTLIHALYYIGMIIIGGMGSITGVFFGVLFIRLLDELVMFASPPLAAIFPWLGSQPAAALGVVAFGVVLLLFLIFEPRGLAHRWEIFKVTYRLHPFAY